MLTADRISVSPQSRWAVPAASLAAASIALVALYWQTFSGMVALWGGSDIYAHSYVVPPISLWLVWRQRHAVLDCTPVPAPRFLLVLAAAIMAWLIGDLASTNVIMHFAAVAAMVTLVPLILGMQIGKLLAFPLGFLFFAVPFGEALFPVMMSATADFTVAALRLTGIPVYREGLQFVIPSGSWSVIEGCSGLRYMVASVMVGSLFGYLNFHSQKRRLVFFGVSIIVPLVANWVRAYLVVLIGHLSGNELATGIDHIIAGWIFFGVIMMLMFTIGGRFADAESAQASPHQRLPAAAAMSGAAKAAQARWGAPVLAIVLLALAPALSSLLEQPSSSAKPVLAALPDDTSAWRSAERPTGEVWVPAFLPPAAAMTQWFSKGDQRVGMYLAYYRQQGANSKLVSYQNQLVPAEDKHWTPVASGIASVDAEGRPLKVNTAELRGNAGSVAPRMLVWQLYWLNGHWTHSNAEAKAVGLLHKLMGRGDDAASVVFFTDKDDSGEGAQALLATFVKENLTRIDQQLQKTHGDTFVSR